MTTAIEVVCLDGVIIYKDASNINAKAFRQAAATTSRVIVDGPVHVVARVIHSLRSESTYSTDSTDSTDGKTSTISFAAASSAAAEESKGSSGVSSALAHENKSSQAARPINISCAEMSDMRVYRQYMATLKSLEVIEAAKDLYELEQWMKQSRVIITSNFTKSSACRSPTSIKIIFPYSAHLKLPDHCYKFAFACLYSADFSGLTKVGPVESNRAFEFTLAKDKYPQRVDVERAMERFITSYRDKFLGRPSSPSTSKESTTTTSKTMTTSDDEEMNEVIWSLNGVEHKFEC